MTAAQSAIVEHARACEMFSALLVEACDAGNLQSAQAAADMSELHALAAFVVAQGVGVRS